MRSAAPGKELPLAVIQAGDRLPGEPLWGKGAGGPGSRAGGGSRDGQRHLGLHQQEHSEEVGAGVVPSAQHLSLVRLTCR